MKTLDRLGIGLVALGLFCGGCAISGSAKGALGSEDARESLAGFVNMEWDAASGRAYMLLPEQGSSWLYTVSLVSGLGSNDVGLDRGQLGGQYMVQCEARGGRLFLSVPNTEWRGSDESSAGSASVEESFAKGVLWGFDAERRDGGGIWVDATDFLLRDAHRIAAKLSAGGQGSFELDRSRSSLSREGLRSFDDNTFVDACLTFTSASPGFEVRATAADPHAVQFQVRHGFVRLPDENYQPRAFHPRSGYFPTGWRRLDAPVDADMQKRVITRHRLQRKSQLGPLGEAVEPIVYYVDRAAPEPVRSALVEGARYWERAFEAAGFENGFRVELLPAGADPHDLRYNVIQWVNRSTRGWSYGDSIVDPRSGEILKGHVTLGALRVRQDVLLAQGLLSPYASGRRDSESTAAVDMALARIRQLAAHEVGHTLGLAHNFAASADDRASVMDYPAPLVRLGANGKPDLSEAYADGCGEWDLLAIRYGYTNFIGADQTQQKHAEEQGLSAILAEARARGLHYMTDRDARGNDRAHPLANLWDNGRDPVEHLSEVYQVRRAALDALGGGVLSAEQPWAELEEVFVPVYLHHRFQIEACIRALGGIEYDYDMRKDASFTPVRPVRAAAQRRALELALRSLDADFLALPDELLERMPPRPPGYESSRELMHAGALIFDPAQAAAASIEWTLSLLLDPERCRRLEDQSAADPSQPSMREVLAELEAAAWDVRRDGRDRGAGSQLRRLLLNHAMQLAAEPGVDSRVAAQAWALLGRVGKRVAGDNALLRWEQERIRRFEQDPGRALQTIEPARIPPGSPIGCGAAPYASFGR